MDRIKLIKNNNNRKWSDLDWVTEFHEFLQGRKPEGLSFTKGHEPKMSHKKAMAIVWYLQEHFSILPDNIEMCSNCKGLYDCESEGIYWESKAKHFCGNCTHLVPYNYDRGKK